MGLTYCCDSCFVFIFVLFAVGFIVTRLKIFSLKIDNAIHTRTEHGSFSKELASMQLLSEATKLMLYLN